MTALLDVEGLRAGYGSKEILFDVDIKVSEGEVVGIIGHNGAGKSTTLRAIFGMLSPQRGKVVFGGRDVTGATCRRNVISGMSLIPSERFVFADQTVRENLLLGCLYERSHAERSRRMAMVQELFPMLSDRQTQQAGTLSGGQQRMLALAISLMANPKLLLLDEPSLGIAPALATTVFDTLKQLTAEHKLSVLIVEQNVAQLLRIVDRVYVMRSGRLVLEESAREMQARDSYWDLF
jgi:branched-chain amino acid transport system ATP-binding protein